MQTFTEARHAGEFILSELDGHGSRDNITIALNQTIIPGMILGATEVVSALTSQVIAGAGNTGNGVLTLANPATSNTVQDGDYILTATDAVHFSVQTPDGHEIGPLAVGQAFNKDVKLSIAAGSTAFVAGDSFVVRVGVEGGDRQYAPLNPAANDGTQKAAAIAIHGAVTDGVTTAQIAAITRVSEVIGPALTWPAGISAAQKAEAMVQLRKAGISIR